MHRTTAMRVLGAVVAALLTLVLLGLALKPSRFAPQMAKATAAVVLAVAWILFGAIVGIAIGKEKTPKLLRSRRGLVLAGACAAALVLASVWLNVGAEERESQLTPVPQEVEIAMMASAQGAAEQYLNVLYSDDPRWRAALRALPESEGESLMAEGEPISDAELQIVLATAGITPSAAVLDPQAPLEHVRVAQNYTVRLLDEEIPYVHLSTVVITRAVQVEAYRLSPMEITDGETKEFAEARTLSVILHRIPARPEWGETGRDLYLVAGLVFE